MNDAPGKKTGGMGRCIWLVSTVAILIGGAFGQLHFHRINEESLLELTQEEEKLATLAKSLQEAETQKSRWSVNRTQLADSERVFLREIRSFDRPEMKAALIDRLELPDQDCVFSMIESSIRDYQSMLVYASEPGQKLSIPVWDSDVELKGQVKKKPQHHFEVDVTPGEIHRVKVGLVDAYSEKSRFVVQFNDEELLSISLKGSGVSRSTVSGNPNTTLFYPGQIGNVLDGFHHDEIEVELFRKGLWLKQGDMRFEMLDKKAEVKRHLMFCVYWLTSGERIISDPLRSMLPKKILDEFRLEEDEATGLHRVVPR